MNKTAQILQDKVMSLIERGMHQPADDDEFDGLARAIFAFQYQECAAYRAYCLQRDHTPDTVRHWTEIPAVPTRAFKNAALACFPTEDAAAVFHTSGTTTGRPGQHCLQNTELYEAAIVPNFAAHLLPDGRGPLTMLVLTPSREESPHSSLSHMMACVIDRFGDGDSGYYVRQGTLRTDVLADRLADAQRTGQPVFLLGTAFAFVHWFEYCLAHKLGFELPPGSRVMETGGFKGRAKAIPKRKLYALIEQALHVPQTRIVDEYGMTELSTQFYDQTMRAGSPTDWKTVPPWARLRVIDPATGEESPREHKGMIRIWDLANLWSVLCVQTEDLGCRRGDGFELLGRVADAEVRGCSLNAEFLSVT